jgi:hypothetical protein
VRLHSGIAPSPLPCFLSVAGRKQTAGGFARPTFIPSPHSVPAMATPLLASLALVSSALPSPAPFEQLFHDHKMEMPSLSLGAKHTGDSPLFAPPPSADLPFIASQDTRPAHTEKAPELQSLMPVLKAPLFDPKLVHAPKDKDTDFKLIVKEVRVAAAK